MKRGLIRKFPIKKKKGQVWIETVIYTLIAFVMIGLVLSFARPKIEELQDQAVLQQSTTLMKEIDSTILKMGAAGNQRVLEIGIKKGELRIDGDSDMIVFEMESKSLYSEPGREIEDGNIIIYTEEKSGYNIVNLTLDYSEDYDIRFQGKDESKIISKASTPYKLTILNEGKDDEDKTILNMSLT